MFIKRILCILSLLLFASIVYGQNQMELNMMSAQSYEIAKGELDLLCLQINIKLPQELKEKFSIAQKKWKEFVDASYEAALFDSSPEGSMHQMEVNNFLTKLTKDRIKQLKELYSYLLR